VVIWDGLAGEAKEWLVKKEKSDPAAVERLNVRKPNHQHQHQYQAQRDGKQAA
jgi:hypothetical protein